MPTPLHSIRVDPGLWQQSLAAARSQGETVTDVLIRALRAYVIAAPPVDDPDRQGQVVGRTGRGEQT